MEKIGQAQSGKLPMMKVEDHTEKKPETNQKITPVETKNILPIEAVGGASPLIPIDSYDIAVLGTDIETLNKKKNEFIQLAYENINEPVNKKTKELYIVMLQNVANTDLDRFMEYKFTYEEIYSYINFFLKSSNDKSNIKEKFKIVEEIFCLKQINHHAKNLFIASLKVIMCDFNNLIIKERQECRKSTHFNSDAYNCLDIIFSIYFQAALKAIDINNDVSFKIFEDFVNTVLPNIQKSEYIFAIIFSVSIFTIEYANHSFIKINLNLTEDHISKIMNMTNLFTQLINKRIINEKSLFKMSEHLINMLLAIRLDCQKAVPATTTAVIKMLPQYFELFAKSCFDNMIAVEKTNLAITVKPYIPSSYLGSFFRLNKYFNFDVVDFLPFIHSAIKISNILPKLMFNIQLTYQHMFVMIQFFFTTVKKTCFFIAEGNGDIKISEIDQLAEMMYHSSIRSLKLMNIAKKKQWSHKNDDTLIVALKETITVIRETINNCTKKEKYNVALHYIHYQTCINAEDCQDICFLSSVVVMSRQGNISARAYLASALLQMENLLPNIALTTLFINRNVITERFDNHMLLDKELSDLDNVTDIKSTICINLCVKYLLTIALYEYDYPGKINHKTKHLKCQLIEMLKTNKFYLPIAISAFLTQSPNQALCELKGKKNTLCIWFKGWIQQHLEEYDSAIELFLSIKKDSSQYDYISANLAVCYYHKIKTGNGTIHEMEYTKDNLEKAIALYQKNTLFTFIELETLKCYLNEVNKIIQNTPVATVKEANKSDDSSLWLLESPTTSKKMTTNKKQKAKKSTSHTKVAPKLDTLMVSKASKTSSSDIIEGVDYLSDDYLWTSSDSNIFNKILKNVVTIIKQHTCDNKPSKKQMTPLDSSWRVQLSGKKTAAIKERSDYINFNPKIRVLDKHLENIGMIDNFGEYSLLLVGFLTAKNMSYVNNIELLFDRLGWLILSNLEIFSMQTSSSIKELTCQALTLFFISICYTVSSDNFFLVTNYSQVELCVSTVLSNVNNYLSELAKSEIENEYFQSAKSKNRTITYQIKLRLKCRLSNLAHALENNPECKPQKNRIIKLRNSLQTDLDKIQKEKKQGPYYTAAEPTPKFTLTPYIQS